MIGAIIGAVGIGLSLFGMSESQDAAQAQLQAQQQQIAFQQQQEKIRREAMKHDAARRRREAIRMFLIAKSQSLTATNASGARNSSATPGAYATKFGEMAFNVGGTIAQEKFGHQMFQTNQGILGAKMLGAQADAQRNEGLGLMQMGSTLINNMGAIDRIGTNLYNTDLGSIASLGGVSVAPSWFGSGGSFTN
jgi:hypothetical protein